MPYARLYQSYICWCPGCYSKSREIGQVACDSSPEVVNDRRRHQGRSQRNGHGRRQSIANPSGADCDFLTKVAIHSMSCKQGMCLALLVHVICYNPPVSIERRTARLRLSMGTYLNHCSSREKRIGFLAVGCNSYRTMASTNHTTSNLPGIKYS